MHESMSVMSDTEWHPDRRTSQIEQALVRLDETLAKADAVARDLIGRLDIVLQPEEPSAEKEGGVLPMAPTSTVTRRLDESTRAVESIIRRLQRATDRLDT